MTTLRFSRKTYATGNSIVLSLPEELREYLNLEVGDEVSLQPEKGRHGNYITLWKKGMKK